MERVGRCVRCGDCCQLFGLMPLDDTAEWREWLEVRLPDAETLKRENSPYLWVKIYAPCPHLKIDGAIATCGLQGSGKPQVCLDGPLTPDGQSMSCGFAWIDD